jgi:2-haloacid dehalogenase
VTRPRVLLFDVFGTLVDWRSGLIRRGIALRPDLEPAWPQLIDDWRRAYQPAMDEVALGGGPWRDLDDVQAQTLDAVLDGSATVLSGAERSRLLRGWRALDPWPDVRAGLAALRELSVTATLSNGHVALVVDLLRHGDLRVDAPLSAQLAQSYKPQPVVYLHALQLLDAGLDEAMLVACHARDLRAAAALGIRTAFVRRPAEWGPAGGDEPPVEIPGLIVVDGLPELAEVLGAER